jgi:hypothetical protein
LASSNPDEEDAEMKEVEEVESEGIKISTMAHLMLSGHYTYLTYLILSTTCFFFWMTPNWYKFRGIFKNKGGVMAYEKYPLNKSNLTQKV